jgi:hypothetical protein
MRNSVNDKYLYVEKQYLGSNRYSILARTLLALFCFIAYYWSENPKPVEVQGIHIGSYPADEIIPNSGALFFLLGITILVISAILVFVLHIKTVVTEESVTLEGLWTARKVKINLSAINQAEIVPYSSYSLNRAVYNLHKNGVVRFYTSGDHALLLTDNEGLKYLIGTQRPAELLLAIDRK